MSVSEKDPYPPTEDTKLHVAQRTRLCLRWCDRLDGHGSQLQSPHSPSPIPCGESTLWTRTLVMRTLDWALGVCRMLSRRLDSDRSGEAVAEAPSCQSIMLAIDMRVVDTDEGAYRFGVYDTNGDD